MRIDELQQAGRIAWAEDARGWIGDPDEIVGTLRDEGFDECKRELLRTPRRGAPTGGLWQGVNPRTGAVGSAVWVRRGDRVLVFVDIDGTPIQAGE